VFFPRPSRACLPERVDQWTNFATENAKAAVVSVVAMNHLMILVSMDAISALTSATAVLTSVTVAMTPAISVFTSAFVAR
jgi:hypothetical protein